MAQVETTIWNCHSKECKEEEIASGKHQIMVETDEDGNIEVYCARCGGRILN